MLDDAWQLFAIPREDRASSKCSLNASRSFRMDSLSAGITTSVLGAVVVGELSSVVNWSSAASSRAVDQVIDLARNR